MNRPCAFCDNRADCMAEQRNCAVVENDGGVKWVSYEPWAGSYETKKEEK